MFIRLNKIKISKEFKNHNPKNNKMDDKNYFYIINGTFKEKIILNKDNVLVDGYTTYLLAKMYEKKFIWVHKRR